MFKTLLVGAFVAVTMGQEDNFVGGLEGLDIDPVLSVHLEKRADRANDATGIKEKLKENKPGKGRPITKEIIDDIKNHTSLWTPFEEDENPLSGMTEEELENLVGSVVD